MPPTNPPPASDATPTPGAGDDLERKARAATPGPWHVQGVGIGGIEDTAGNVIAQAQQFKPVRNRDDLNDRIQNAAFIAAANPSAVLALIASLRAAETRNVDLWAVIDKLTADGCRAVTALIACEAERDALRAAVEPFAKMASGIPDNWPGDVVLFYDIANPAYPERALSLGYWPAWFNDGGWRPTIDDYRRIAALARGPAAGETTDGGGKD